MPEIHMQLRSNIRGKTKIGYLVSADRSGFFVYAEAGSTPIGVITESVSRGELCEIQTTGEALVYVYGSVGADQPVRTPEATEQAPAGASLPVGSALAYTKVGQALETGKGLIRVSISLGATSSSSGGVGNVPPGGSTGQMLIKASATDYDTTWSTFTPIADAPSDGTPYARQDATWVSAEIDIYTTVYRATIPIGGILDFAAAGGSGLSVDYVGGAVTYSFTPPGSYYSGWYADADTGDTPVAVGDLTTVTFIGGSYINTDYQFLTPDHSVTINLDISTLDTHIATNHYTKTQIDGFNFISGDAPSDGTPYARQDANWVNADFDVYTTVYRATIPLGGILNFEASGSGLSVDYVSGAVRYTFTPAGSYYSGWYADGDSGDTPVLVSDTNTVTFEGGNSISTVYDYISGTNHRVIFNLDTTITVNVINEYTLNSGVTVDGVLLKDSTVFVDTISEKTAGAGVTIDSVLLKDNTATAIWYKADNGSGYTAVLQDAILAFDRANTSYIRATSAGGYLSFIANGLSASSANALTVIGTAAVTLRYGSSSPATKLTTTTLGIDVTGEVSLDMLSPITISTGNNTYYYKLGTLAGQGQKVKIEIIGNTGYSSEWGNITTGLFSIGNADNEYMGWQYSIGNTPSDTTQLFYYDAGTSTSIDIYVKLGTYFIGSILITQGSGFTLNSSASTPVANPGGVNATKIATFRDDLESTGEVTAYAT